MPRTADPERQPLLRSQSSKHGTTAPLGSSTLLQTVFNSTNVLLGVGLLSLPLGIKYAGWLIGTLLLIFCALVTAYTARVLARCLDADKSLATYADLAYAAYGSKACGATRVLFSFIMIAACTALLILFGDVMNLLVPALSIMQWKLVCGLILIPLQFLPFSALSVASMLGVAASLGLVVLTILAGILKTESPGSLRSPATTHLFPESWTRVPLSIGLLMSPWGGHASFPNLYRDMREPKQYGRSLVLTYSATFAVDFAMAVCGYLMYGSDTMDEIVANILVTDGHSRVLLISVVALVAVMPVTKIPLSSRPLVTMIEGALYLDPALAMPGSRKAFVIHFMRVGLRFLIVMVVVALSILCPNFDVIMGFAGSALCFTICIILPLVFYLKLYEGQIGPLKKTIDWILVGIATVMAVTGTVWALIPKAYLE